MNPDIITKRTPREDVMELEISGKLVSQLSSTLRASLEWEVDQNNHKLILNMRKVYTLSSACLGAIVHCRKLLLECKGDAILLDCPITVVEAIEALGLQTVLPKSENLREALAYFNEASQAPKALT